MQAALRALRTHPGILHGGLLLGSTLFVALFHFGGLALLGSQYTAVDPFLGIPHLLTYGTTLGVLLALLGASLGPHLLGWALLVAAQRRGSPLLSLALCAALGALALLVCVHAWAAVIVPAETAAPKQDALRQFLGGLALCAYAPLALCAACVCAPLAAAAAPPGGALAQWLGGRWCGGGGGGKRSAALRALPLTQEASLAAGGAWWAGALLLPLAAALTLASAVLPPIWTLPASEGFKLPADSTGVSWSLLPPAAALARASTAAALVYVKLYPDVVVFFAVLLALAGLGCVGTYTPALRRRLHARLRVPPRLAPLHYLFPTGVCLGELLLLAALAGLYAFWGVYWGRIYTRFAEETALYGDKSGLQAAARLLGHWTTLTMSLLCFPVARNSVLEGVFGVPFDRAIKAHRALGALCWVLVTAHMVLWQVKWAAEGVLWRNVVTVNRLEVTPCGQAPKVPQSCWRDGGGTAYLSPEGLRPPVSGPGSCGCYWYSSYSNATGQPDGGIILGAPGWHVDNFTILLAQASWLLLTGALAVALALRRTRYQLFLLTHYAALLFFAVALIHAWAHWVYAAAGLLLYALDKVLRAVGAARRVRVARAGVCAPGVVVLALEAASALPGGRLFAGQYVWLNVAAAGLGEWHPFTVSSPPAAAAAGKGGGGEAGGEASGGGEVVFHIKVNGPGSWTARLAAAVRAATAAGSAGGGGGGGGSEGGEGVPGLTVSLDGPYGRLGGVEDAAHLVMFAGGVGVTPFVALLGELRARGGAGRRATLVWAIREEAWLEVLAGELAPLLRGADREWCELRLFLTSGGGGGGEGGEGGGALKFAAATETDSLLGGRGAGAGAGAPASACAQGWASSADAEALRGVLQRGRPSAAGVLRGVVEGRAGGARGVLAMVCGPQQLAEAVSEAAFECGTEYHAETFTF